MTQMQALFQSPIDSLAQVEGVSENGFSDTTVALILGSFVVLLLIMSWLGAVVLHKLWHRRRRKAAAGAAQPAPKLSTRAKFAALGTTTLLIFALFLGGSYEAYGYWSDPAFCSSCHIMEPYHASWSASAHAEVRCVECHFEPGIGNELHGKWVAVKQLATWLAGAYSSMPYAVVSDASCMRSGCHSREDLAAPITYSEREILFDHAAHLGEMRRGITLACSSCHHQRLITNHMEVDKATCFLCHFKNGSDGENAQADCSTCHGPPAGLREAGSLSVDHQDYVHRGMECTQCHVELKPGGGSVGEARCLSCHNRPDQLARYGDLGFLHAEHVTGNKLHCYQCHTLVEHSLENGAPPGQDCASCHGSTLGKQGQFYAGVGASGVPAMPDAMHLLGVDCAGCHRSLPAAAGASNGHVFQSGAESCQTCHGDRYSGFVTAVSEVFDEVHAHLAKRSGGVQTELESRRDAGQPIDAEILRAAEDVQSDLDFVGRVGYIHNPLYGIEILRHGERELAALEEKMGLPASDDLPEGLYPEDCYVCHDTLPEPGVIDLGDGRSYPHPLHLEQTGLDCADCHLGEVHPPRASTAENSCKLCHDQ